MEDRQAAKIAIALTRALDKPQLLDYIRRQIIADFKRNLSLITDKEADTFIERTKEERKTQETR